MLNELFGKILGLEEEVNEGLNLQFGLIEAFENGAVDWTAIKDVERKCKLDKVALKATCHDFFREVIWTAEQSNVTLGELLLIEELSQQWERVEGIVKDTFPWGTLEEICCK